MSESKYQKVQKKMSNQVSFFVAIFITGICFKLSDFWTEQSQKIFTVLSSTFSDTSKYTNKSQLHILPSFLKQYRLYKLPHTEQKMQDILA